MPQIAFPPRRRTYKKKKFVKKPRAKLSKPVARAVKAIVSKHLNKVVETKRAVWSSPDGLEMSHNQIMTIDSNPLFTSQGITDPANLDTANRIGDKIFSKGIGYRMMFELNERYTDVTIRLMFVRSARNDAPTRASLFCGASGNKMLDIVNTERHTILYQKYFKIKAGNATATSGVEAGGAGSGITNLGLGQGLSRASRLVKFWIPGRKLGNKGTILYDGAGYQCKTYDYTLVAFAYSNYSTLQDVWNIARLNDIVRVHYFQDP